MTILVLYFFIINTSSITPVLKKPQLYISLSRPPQTGIKSRRLMNLSIANHVKSVLLGSALLLENQFGDVAASTLFQLLLDHK